MNLKGRNNALNARIGLRKTTTTEFSTMKKPYSESETAELSMTELLQENMVSCEICGDVFAAQRNLNHHKGRVHSDGQKEVAD